MNAQQALDHVAQHCPLSYRGTMTGISEWYAVCGSLSRKQYALVRMNAGNLGITLPADLKVDAVDEDYGADPLAPGNPQAEGNATAMLERLRQKNTSTVGGNGLATASGEGVQAVIADLLADVARACERAVGRLS